MLFRLSVDIKRNTGDWLSAIAVLNPIEERGIHFECWRFVLVKIPAPRTTVNSIRFVEPETLDDFVALLMPLPCIILYPHHLGLFR